MLCRSSLSLMAVIVLPGGVIPTRPGWGMTHAAEPRGAYMTSATPTRQISAPVMSNRFVTIQETAAGPGLPAAQLGARRLGQTRMAADNVHSGAHSIVGRLAVRAR